MNMNILRGMSGVLVGFWVPISHGMYKVVRKFVRKFCIRFVLYSCLCFQRVGQLTCSNCIFAAYYMICYWGVLSICPL